MLKRLTVLLVILSGVTIGAQSSQVLELLVRNNTWTGTQTFQDLRMTPATVPATTTNRIYADLAGNLYYNGDPSGLKAKYSSNTDVPVFDISGFYFHDAAVQTNGVDDPVKQRADTRIRLANNVRSFASRYNGVRGPVLKTWDLSFVKQVRLAGNVRAQFNIEFLNAFNQTYFNNANTDPTNVNFGKVTTQNNLPRDIQLAAKIVF